MRGVIMMVIGMGGRKRRAEVRLLACESRQKAGGTRRHGSGRGYGAAFIVVARAVGHHVFFGHIGFSIRGGREHKRSEANWRQEYSGRLVGEVGGGRRGVEESLAAAARVTACEAAF